MGNSTILMGKLTILNGKITMFNGKTNYYKWPFSLAGYVAVYQRVTFLDLQGWFSSWFIHHLSIGK